jgi:hypothetical protein
MDPTSPQLNMLQSLFSLFHSKLRILSYIILVLISSGIWWYFTDIRIMFGNYGEIHTYTDIVLSIIMILLFPLFILAIIYKGRKYWKRTDINSKSFIGMMGGSIGTILSGCSCCGLTLASYFGLLPLMGFLPYDGLEIKILWALGLLYATWDILVNLETCRIKR